MLFSEAVVLVEGVAELLIIPSLAARLGVSLSEQGVSVVSVDGLAFNAFISIFDDGGLPINCAVITDSDAKRVDDDDDDDEDEANAEEIRAVPERDDEPATDAVGTPDEKLTAGSAESVNSAGPTEPLAMEDGGEWRVSNTAAVLKGRETDRISVFLARRTLEWDLAQANFGDKTALLAALYRVKPRVSKRLERTTYESADQFADAFLTAIANVKGRFAQELAAQLDLHSEQAFVVPTYIAEAIGHVAPVASSPSLFDQTKSDSGNGGEAGDDFGDDDFKFS